MLGAWAGGSRRSDVRIPPIAETELFIVKPDMDGLQRYRERCGQQNAKDFEGGFHAALLRI